MEAKQFEGSIFGNPICHKTFFVANFHHRFQDFKAWFHFNTVWILYRTKFDVEGRGHKKQFAIRTEKINPDCDVFVKFNQLRGNLDAVLSHSAWSFPSCGFFKPVNVRADSVFWNFMFSTVAGQSSKHPASAVVLKSSATGWSNIWHDLLATLAHCVCFLAWPKEFSTQIDVKTVKGSVRSWQNRLFLMWLSTLALPLSLSARAWGSAAESMQTRKS